jgi:hypothetical protein
VCFNHQDPVLHHYGSQHTASVASHLFWLLRHARGCCGLIRSTRDPHRAQPLYCTFLSRFVWGVTVVVGTTGCRCLKSVYRIQRQLWQHYLISTSFWVTTSRTADDKCIHLRNLGTTSNNVHEQGRWVSARTVLKILDKVNSRSLFAYQLKPNFYS